VRNVWNHCQLHQVSFTAAFEVKLQRICWTVDTVFDVLCCELSCSSVAVWVKKLEHLVDIVFVVLHYGSLWFSCCGIVRERLIQVEVCDDCGWFGWTSVKGTLAVIRTVGLILNSSFRGRYLQMAVVLHPAIGCHYFLPGLQLPSLLQIVAGLDRYEFIYTAVNFTRCPWRYSVSVPLMCRCPQCAWLAAAVGAAGWAWLTHVVTGCTVLVLDGNQKHVRVNDSPTVAACSEL